MHSIILVVESVKPDQSPSGWLLSGIEKALTPHPEIKFLSKNVLLIPSHLVLLAISEVDAQCREHSQSGQNFAYKSLFLEGEPVWIHSTGLPQ